MDEPTIYLVTENEPDRRLVTLDHEVLECCNCGAKEKLLRIPELTNEIWCHGCAESETYE